MSGPAQTAPSRDLLLANHDFPCAYVIKAFGPNNDAFRSGIVASAVTVLSESHVTTSERTTKNGRQICVTLTLRARTVEDVEAVYAGIYDVEDLRLIF